MNALKDNSVYVRRVITGYVDWNSPIINSTGDHIK